MVLDTPFVLPSPLPTLTLWQPWAWALFNAGKDVENRPRNMGVTGWIAIHVALRWDEDDVLDALTNILSLNWPMAPCVGRGQGAIRDEMYSQRGCIIGLVDIESWKRKSEIASRWVSSGPGWAAVVRRAVPLTTHIPCRDGFHRGVWKVPHACTLQVIDSLQARSGG